jgi:hypothetical protein
VGNRVIAGQLSSCWQVEAALRAALRDEKDVMGRHMVEAYIARRNIERFRRMLEEETDESARRAIESMIREFEGMSPISAPETSSVDANRRSSGKSESG